MKNTIFILILLLWNIISTVSQSEFTIVTLDNPAPGYLFLQTNSLDYIGLFDNSGYIAYKKKLYKSETAITMELQPNERISYFSNNKFYIVDYNFNMIDSFACKNGYDQDFHVIRLTSNGHAFLIGIEYIKVDMSVIVTGGNPDATLWSSVIQEQDENKNVVWEWHTHDHYQVTDAASDVNLTQNYIDWVHTNWIEIDYDGNIIISNRYLDEITKINKQTGDIIWRLGGKECKNNQFTFLNDTIDGFWGFSHQHMVRRLSNGNLLLFDNGNLRPSPFSRAVEYEIDEVNKTIRKVWEYHNFPEVFTLAMGSVQRLPNGNTIIGWGTNHRQITFTEVMPDNTRVMEAMYFDSYLALRYPIKMASKLLMVQNSGNYSFSDTSNKTGVSLNINSMTGSGYVSVERHYYLPHNVSFEGSPPLSAYGHRWVLNNKGISQFSGKIIFNLTDIDSLDSPEMNKVYWREHEGSGSFTELETSYNQSLGTIEASISHFGEFILGEPPVYQIPIQTAPPDNSKKNPLSVDLLWKKVVGSDSYKLQLSDNKNFLLNLIDTIIVDDTTFSYQLPENNKSYYWRLKSVFGSNESSWSNTWKFTTQLKSPELISPADREKDFPVNGLFKWNSISGATYYVINISKTTDFDSLIINETGITDSSFNLASLEFGKEYYWRVKAMNLDNESLWSDTNSFTIADKKILSAPILLSPANDATEVPIEGYLSWNPVGDASAYNVEMSLYPDFFTNIISEKDIDTTSLYYNNLNYNAIYYWRVKAFNAKEQSLWSNVWMFTTKSETSVNNKNINEKNLQIYYSNDGKPAFIFSNCPTGLYHFGLFDIRGNLIMESNGYFIGEGEKQIILVKENLRSGLYIYRMLSGYQIFTGKIILEN